MLGIFSRNPLRPGVHDGRLADCPSSPNCVCTQATDAGHRSDPIPFRGPAQEAMVRLKSVITALPRTRIVTAEAHYLHVEFTSRLMRFVDDVEFLIDAAGQVIHFRSASRLGYSDFGVNRRRMEDIRQNFVLAGEPGAV